MANVSTASVTNSSVLNEEVLDVKAHAKTYMMFIIGKYGFLFFSLIYTSHFVRSNLLQNSFNQLFDQTVISR